MQALGLYCTVEGCTLYTVQLKAVYCKVKAICTLNLSTVRARVRKMLKARLTWHEHSTTTYITAQKGLEIIEEEQILGFCPMIAYVGLYILEYYIFYTWNAILIA